MAKTAQIFCKAVDSYTMISMLIEQFFMYCDTYLHFQTRPPARRIARSLEIKYFQTPESGAGSLPEIKYFQIVGFGNI